MYYSSKKVSLIIGWKLDPQVQTPVSNSIQRDGVQTLYKRGTRKSLVIIYKILPMIPAFCLLIFQIRLYTDYNSEVDQDPLPEWPDLNLYLRMVH